MVMKFKLILLFLLVSFNGIDAQTLPALERIEPAFWWVGMKNQNLQLLVHGDKVADSEVSFNYDGVTLKKVNKVENPNYLFLDLEISSSAIAGTFPITLKKKGSKAMKYIYEL